MLEKEFRKKAEEKGVPKATIFKDWLLSYILKGIMITPDFPGLIFKGGTCLRKCYFEGYRFSEDLDFTLREENKQISNENIQKIVENTQRLLKEPPLHFKLLTPIHSEDQLVGYDVDLRYWGSLNKPPTNEPNSWNDKIELQLRFHEKVVFNTEAKSLLHDYTDHENLAPTHVNSYSIEEILAEKLRSLLQRPKHVAPRDCYDIWYLTLNANPDWKKIIEGFNQKIEFKRIKFNGPEEFITQKDENMINRLWYQSLGNQISEKELPESQMVINYLQELLHEKFG